jgi:methylglutaconyl-CoA hydratase
MIEFQDQKYFAKIILNSPETKNALSLKDLKELQIAFLKIAHETQYRFVVIEGSGGVFCSGANLHDMQSAKDKSFEQNLEDAQLLHQMFHAMWDIPQPILLKVQGYAMGGGLGLVALADWVISEATAKFAFSEVRLGIAPAVISDFILRKFNLSQIASEMITGSFFGSERALQMGLIHKVVEKEMLEEAVTAKVDELLNCGPLAMTQTKRLVRNLTLMNNDLDRYEMVTHLIADLRVGAEGQEGLKAFLEKRKPSWAVGAKK